MIQEINSFLLNPQLFAKNNVKADISSKIKTLFKVYLICMVMLALSTIPIGIIEVILKNTINFSIYENLKNNQLNFRSYWADSAWLITVILGPISEEIVFRLPLTANRPPFALSIGFALFYFTGDIIDIDSFSSTRITASLLVFFLLHLFLTNKVFIWLRLNLYNFLCWGSIISFSWVHIGNFAPLNWNIIYLYPIYVLPQLFSGIGLSFLMVKYQNIIWPLLLHIIINGVPALLRTLH